MRWMLTVAATMAIGGAVAADPIEGTWKTQPDDGAYAYVEMAPCGPSYCGVIKRTFRDGTEYASDNIGKELVQKMTPIGGNAYEGKLWRPSNDKIYTGKASVKGDTMQLAGCVFGGLFCAKQTWTRIE